MHLTPRIFRQLILASIAATVAAIVIELGFPELLPESIRQANAELVNEPLGIWTLLAVGLATLASTVICIVNTVALYAFRSWARKMNVALCLLGILVMPAFGPAVSSGLGRSLMDLSWLLWGAVTALSFVPPIHERFINHGIASDRPIPTQSH